MLFHSKNLAAAPQLLLCSTEVVTGFKLFKCLQVKTSVSKMMNNMSDVGPVLTSIPVLSLRVSNDVIIYKLLFLFCSQYDKKCVLFEKYRLKSFQLQLLKGTEEAFLSRTFCIGTIINQLRLCEQQD